MTKQSAGLMLALAILMPQVAVAEEPGQNVHHGESEHAPHPHHVALFGGVTKAEHHDEEATFGLDYEYRLNEKFGIGAIVDRATGDLDTTVAAISLTLHPWRGLYALAAPGYEFHDGHEEFLVRVGIGYAFHFGERYSIGPTYNIDFVNDEEIDIYGLSFGFGF